VSQIRSEFVYFLITAFETKRLYTKLPNVRNWWFRSIWLDIWQLCGTTYNYYTSQFNHGNMV